MKTRSLPMVALVAAALLAFALAPTRAQDASAPPAGGAAPGFTPDQMMAMMEEMSKPAPEHARFEPLIGRWNYALVWQFPGMAPITARGTSENTWIMSGRFVQNTQVTDPSEPMKVESMAVLGYDTRFQKYTLWGIDTMGTYSVSAEGGKDAVTGDSITLTGWNEEPGIGKVQFRWVITFEGPDTHRQDIFFQGRDGSWPSEPMVAVTYTRIK